MYRDSNIPSGSKAFTLIELPVVRKRKRTAFTLIELLIVVAIIALLVTITVPSLAGAKTLARRTVCAGNLRHLYQGFLMYLTNNDWEYFPYKENLEGGILWYWGFEPTDAPHPEGSRPLDRSRARLAPYLEHTGAMQICPEAVRVSTRGDFKPKFDLASYGYAINRRMMSGQSGGVNFDRITAPSRTVAWADSMQINTWQLPASVANPMLEDWYYLDNRSIAPATFHFRHGDYCSSALVDASVGKLEPHWLDARCDGRVGRPEPAAASSQVSEILRLDK